MVGSGGRNVLSSFSLRFWRRGETMGWNSQSWSEREPNSRSRIVGSTLGGELISERRRRSVLLGRNAWLWARPLSFLADPSRERNFSRFSATGMDDLVDSN